MHPGPSNRGVEIDGDVPPYDAKASSRPGTNGLAVAWRSYTCVEDRDVRSLVRAHLGTALI